MNERQLFEAALERPPLERAAFLDTACAGDAALRQRIEALLQQNEQAGSFLEHAALTGAFAGADAPGEAAGTLLAGRYKLVERIGEGGMGAVWMAQQQEPVKRLVAVKLIKPGMDSKAVLARFDAERQALALMDHPNIAKVHDAGTSPDGRPYFVMELVKGVPITRFCDERKLTPRQRLELFVPVCQAIQHAHQKGVIHRDVKPSNVLVALYDDKPVPKVIDFGLAKATGLQLTEQTLQTEFGAIVGTVEYMSPEQATFNQLDVDTRSDVYSLGVLLYELLAGAPPFSRQALAKAGMLEILRLIREQEPPRPSTKLSTAEGLPSLAASRGTEPARLTALMRGEIDWIVMKALEKDRARRYETANGLARDLERFLHDEAVEACPPTAGYRLRKFAQKHRRLLATATAFVLVLVLGVVLSTWQAVRATRSETQARRQWYAAKLNQMPREWDSGNLVQLRQLLSETETHPERGFEWYYWQQKCHEELFTFPGVTVPSWSPDGKRMATVSDLRGTVTLWEAGSGGEWVKWRVHPERGSVAWSPDGKRLASGGMDGLAKVWDPDSGRLLLPPLRVTKGRVWCEAWSPDGKRLATGYGEGVGGWEKGSDGTVKVWDTETGRLLLTLNGHAKNVRSVAWSPDGQWLATAGVDGMVKIWDMTDGPQPVPVASAVALLGSPGGKGPLLGTSALIPATLREVLHLKGHGPRPVNWTPYYPSILAGIIDRAVTSVAWSPDGDWLATSHRDGTAKVWKASSGQEWLTLQPSHQTNVWRVAWSKDGRLATVSRDGTAKVWDAMSGRQLAHLKGHLRGLNSVSWSPDGRSLVTGSFDGTAKVWDVAHTQLQVRVREEVLRIKESDKITSLSWSPKGRWLALGGADGTVNLRDLAGDQSRRPVAKQTGSITALAWSVEEKLATGCANGTLRIWEAAGRRAGPLFGHSSRINAVAWAPDGQRLGTGSSDGTAKVWDVARGEELLSLKAHAGPVLALAWSADGKLLATGSGDATAKVWDVARGREVATLKGHANGILAVAWSPTGQHVATGDWDGTAKVWDAVKGKELLTLRGHHNQVRSVGWSPDGSRLVTASSDGSVKLWEVISGQEVLSFQEHVRPIVTIAWSADGKQLTTGSEDGTVRIARAATAAGVREWAREGRALEEIWAPYLLRGTKARGFIQKWLLLLPVALSPEETSTDALARSHLRNEGQLRPVAGQREEVAGKELVWQEHQAPTALLDFNGVLGRIANHSVAYAACYLHSDRERKNVRLEVGSDDQCKVYLNGREVYQYALPSQVSDLGLSDPVTLHKGPNVLVFKVVNETLTWQGCLRLVGEDGKPVEGVEVRLTP